ncbi:hypothetical protein [Streptomyces broussonetiae]|uniref:Transposase n=1 Tax=Streptomyces broussonetiae TaxID=2686304 RepID=A0A6I6N2G6_9ACTN|nr:hypothetical protein [Streptomyces broussonetiae]QHA02406.1 hypothetical protein GQF42_03060 [Streptomyces broussonetiae]
MRMTGLRGQSRTADGIVMIIYACLALQGGRPESPSVLGGCPVGRTGQCWDSALAESFFATLKNEFNGERPWPSRAVAHTAVFERIEGWRIVQPLDSSLGYRSPSDREATLAACR